MNKFSSFLLLAIFAISASSFLLRPNVNVEEMKELWNTWKALNEKVYAESEEVEKFSVFVQNYVKVVTQNQQHPDTKFALNQFADLSEEEFKAQYLSGLNVDQAALEARQTESMIDYSILATPESVDWRTTGALTPIKNQGSCGSCWAFSAVGALESFNFIKTGNLVAFSEQQVVSCDKKDGGCQGGEMQLAFEYTGENGIETEADYPYKAQNGNCNYDASKAHKVHTGYKNVTANNVDALKAALAVQPVSVAVDATIFQFYFGGVMKKMCGTSLNHGVLAVGYVDVKGKEAFIIKNSWGPRWGAKGFGYISTDKDANKGAGACGILMDASYPTA